MILPEKFHFLDVKPINSSILSIKNKIFQRKLDGTAAEAFIGYDNLGDVRIFGRGVLQYGVTSEYSKRFPEIVQSLKSMKELGLKNTDIVGELIVIDPNTGFENLELVQSRNQRDNNIDRYSRMYPALLIIIDVVEIEGKDVRKLKYLDRMNMLKNVLTEKGWKSENVRFIENFYELNWIYIQKNKLEGVVVRDADAVYNKSIWKIKLIYTEDVYCKGEYNSSDSMTDGGKELFASLICYQLDKEGNKEGKEIYVADVGGGFTEEKRKEIQEMLNSGKINKDNPLVLEIKTFGRANSYSKFRNPIFLRIRSDKPWNKCVIN